MKSGPGASSSEAAAPAWTHRVVHATQHHCHLPLHRADLRIQCPALPLLPQQLLLLQELLQPPVLLVDVEVELLPDVLHLCIHAHSVALQGRIL
jgi:hypothetical protein